MDVFKLLLIIPFAFICYRLEIYFNYRSCLKAKRLNKPICHCWDCSQKCELYKIKK